MDVSESYWLEGIKQTGSRMYKLESIALSLIKFYFVTLFSLTTIVVTLFNYKMLAGNESWFFLIFVIPLLFGLSVFIVLEKIVTEHQYHQMTRNRISEYFVYGNQEVKNKLPIFPMIFSPFTTLIGWLLVVNLGIVVYVAFPIIRSSLFNTTILILMGIALAGIMSSVVLVSLNNARKKARDASRRASIASLRPAIILYEDKYGKYPIAANFRDLMEKLKEFYNTSINDPVVGKGWDFEYRCDDGTTYELSYTLEEGGKQVIGPNDEIK